MSMSVEDQRGIRVDLVVYRPASVQTNLWTDALMDACCKRLVPDLRAFSIGPDECELSVVTRADDFDGLMTNFEALARVCAQWSDAPRMAPAPRPRELIELPCNLAAQ